MLDLKRNRDDEQCKLQDFRMGTLCAVVDNLLLTKDAMRKGAKPRQAKQYFASLEDLGPTMTPEQEAQARELDRRIRNAYIDRAQNIGNQAARRDS